MNKIKVQILENEPQSCVQKGDIGYIIGFVNSPSGEPCAVFLDDGGYELVSIFTNKRSLEKFEFLKEENQ